MSMENRGPKAPKDPTKKRKCFFIMRNKCIEFAPENDGRGICYIYENDGRLISAAGLVGGITDEEELNLLKSTEGFRKLVHSIGVSVESQDPIDKVRFVFQMYGKTDVYGSGTNIVVDVPANGMEIVTELDSLEWSDDDKEPGQIRFEYEKSGVAAEVSVCFYLNDGFDAPVPEDEFPVDTASDDYQKMIEKSLMQQGNNYRIKKAIEKARRGEDTTLAFIGGSITQGAGAVPINSECYARKIFEGFCDIAGCKTDENVNYIKAGVGGTPSELGILRYKKDILDEGTPDLVVVEFAVNDEGDETKGEFYDSLVRKIYDGPGKPAVVLLFAVFVDDFNLQDRLSPVGLKYNLPMVSTKNSVTEQFYLKNGEGRILSKNQFFYDRYHPANIGHRIMAEGVINMMKLADKAPLDDELETLAGIEAPIGGDFQNIIRIDRAINECGAVIDFGSFEAKDTELQCVERNMDLTRTPQFEDNWMFLPSSIKSPDEFKPFTMDVECKSIVLVFKDSEANKVGKANVFVDGNKTYFADPREVGWTHCNAAIVCRGNETKMHHLEIVMSEDAKDKEFTILGFGIVK